MPTPIERFGTALNLNVCFHMLSAMGCMSSAPTARCVSAGLASAELARLTQTVAHPISRYLERQGWLTRDAENSNLAGDGLEAGPLDRLLGSSIT